MKHANNWWKHTGIPWAVVIVLYTIVSIIVCYPFLQDATTSILNRDNLLLNWMVSWNIHALLTDPLHILQANIFYPHPNTLLYSDLLLTQSLLALPIYLFSNNTILSYNILIVLFYVLSAFGTYLLAHYYTKNHYASFIAGLIFGFSTYRIISLGHFQNLSIIWIPFGILFLQMYLDRWKPRYFIYFILCFIAQALATWYNGAFMAFFSLLLMGFHGKELLRHRIQFIKDAAIGVLLIALLIGPFAYKYIEFSNTEQSAYSLEQVIHYSADLGGYLLPSPFSFPAKIVAWVGLEKERWLENINYLGASVLVLVLYYAILGRKKHRITEKPFVIYAVGAVSFIILSMGPALHLFDQTLKIPLPYLAIQAIPVFQFIRVPSRMAIIVLLSLAVIIAYIIRSIHISNKPLRYALAIILPLIIVFESYHPNIANDVVHDVSCPAVYEQVKQNPTVGAILEFPLQSDPFKTVEYVFDSRCHLKPLFNGYSGYQPKDYAFGQDLLSDFPNERSLDYMNMLGITHVVIHTDQLEQPSELLNALAQQPRVQIVWHDGTEYLIAVAPGTASTDSVYYTDYSGLEKDTLDGTLEKEAVVESAVIGGRAFGGIHPIDLSNGIIRYTNIEIPESHTQLHIDLQGQTANVDDSILLTVTDSAGQLLYEQRIHTSDIETWNSHVIPLPSRTELSASQRTVDVSLTLTSHEFPDRTLLNTLLLYTK